MVKMLKQFHPLKINFPHETPFFGRIFDLLSHLMANFGLSREVLTHFFKTCFPQRHLNMSFFADKYSISTAPVDY